MVQPINYLGMMPKRDLGARFLEGLKIGGALGELSQAEKERALKEEFQSDFKDTVERDPSMDNFNRLLIKYPTFAKTIGDFTAQVNQQQKDAEFDQGKNIALALETGNVAVAKNLVQQARDARQNSGLSTKTYDQVFDILSNEENENRGLEAKRVVNMSLAFLDPKKFSDIVDAKEKFQGSPARIAKLTADAEKLEKELAGTLEQDDGVQSSKITPDGTVVIVTKKGNTRVINPAGVELTGQSRINAVRASEEFGVDVQKRRAGAQRRGALEQDISLGGTAAATKKGAEIAQVEGQKAFEALNKVRTNIGNLDAAIAAIDGGAKTGVIESRFPNWRASTIELQNIQRRLGLDIVGSVTFGALSAGELSLALETALPLNLDEKQLRDWLTRKKEAQNKLSGYLTAQATHLLTPGNTLQTWLQQSGARPTEAGAMQARPSGQRSITVEY